MRTLKHLLLIAALTPIAAALPTGQAGAQDRFGTRTGSISFHSSTPVEDIEAHNRKVSCVYDAGTGAIELAVLIKAFEFRKALMQEHFNENYMESNTHPKATFKGTLTGMDAAAKRATGTYAVTIKGDLTMHGVTRPLEEPATLVVRPDGSLKGTARFTVRPEDHDITIPGVVRNNIAERIVVSVDLDLTSL